MPRYTLDSGRCIVRDGVPIATIHGVKNPASGYYTIGGPAYLDDFARDVVGKLDSHDDLLAAAKYALATLTEDLPMRSRPAANRKAVEMLSAAIRRAWGME